MKPANSGGTAADEAVGGASGSGASRTMLMTAPDTPTHVIGTHSASAPHHRSGSNAITAAAPMRANGTSARAGAATWWAIIQPRAIGTPSVWSGWSISCDSGSTASRPSR